MSRRLDAYPHTKWSVSRQSIQQHTLVYVCWLSCVIHASRREDKEGAMERHGKQTKGPENAN
jgi:hypothetical protein